jgi:uncharacterized protein
MKLKKKVKLALSVFIFRYKFISRLLKIDPDIIKCVNEIFKDEFKKIPYPKRAIFLPHCLRARDCPAKLSSDDGILCISCGGCKCGEIKNLSEGMGYHFFIVPSAAFIKRIVLKYRFNGIYGVICDNDVKEIIREEKISSKGGKLNNMNIIPQGFKLKTSNCSKNTVDWENLKIKISES